MQLNNSFGVIGALVALTLSLGVLQYNNTVKNNLPVTTEYGAWSGSGFFINLNGYVATADHVVSDGKKFSVYYKHNFYDAHVIARDKVHDVAILKTNIKPSTYIPVTQIKYQGQKIGIYGYPLGTLKLTLTTGTQTYGGTTLKNVYTHAKSCHGNSGGPVINQSGEAISLLNWGRTGLIDKPCSNEGGGPDIVYLIALAAKHGVALDRQYPGAKASFDYWYRLYNNTIVYIEGSN